MTVFFFFRKKSRAFPKQIMDKRKYFEIPIEPDLIKYILRESDNALQYETRLEQNEYFSSLRNIYHLKPIKMTLQTTVFLYKMEHDHLIDGKIQSYTVNKEGTIVHNKNTDNNNKNAFSNNTSGNSTVSNTSKNESNRVILMNRNNLSKYASTSQDQSHVNSSRYHSLKDESKNKLSHSGSSPHHPTQRDNTKSSLNKRDRETTKLLKKRPQNVNFSNCYFFQKAYLQGVNGLQMNKSKLFIHNLMIRSNSDYKIFYDLKYIVIKRAVIRKETGTQEDVISMKIDHPNLLKTYKTFRLNHLQRKMEYSSDSEEATQQEIVFLYSEFLRFRISNKYVNMNEHIIRTILRDVLNGLGYLHSKNIVHLDIKIANIMGQEIIEQFPYQTLREQRDVSGEYEADRGVRSNIKNEKVSESESSNNSKKRMMYKLIDFGYSRDLSLDSEGKKNGEIFIQSKSYGTYPYKPPEVVFHNIHGKSSDIWCVGAVAWFLSNGKVPFYHEDGEKNTAENRKFLRGQRKHFFHPNISHELKDFILRCMNIKRHLRPSAENLLKHNFITGQKFTDDIDSGYETDTGSSSS